MKNKIFLIAISLIIFSCGETPKKEEAKSENPLSEVEGFWNRIGTIQVVNGVPVDTLLIKNSENTDYRQIKVYKDGNMVWLDNVKSETPWKGGGGGYGKFTVNSEKSLTEHMSAGTGYMAGWVDNYKDSLNVPAMDVTLSIDYKDDIYSQMNGPNRDFMEYWERMPILTSKKSKLDGAWKRVYEIAYINNTPVDTLAVPSDIILDVKIMTNGRFAYQVDLTGNAEVDTPQYGGFGGYGYYDYDDVDQTLKEYPVFGSGSNTTDREEMQRTNFQTHEIKFYNDDLFIQIDKSNQGMVSYEGATGRGVVYRRIK
tara:strand:+ start:1329 stop:2264 length:936 start_codon:yes stop_codon:yes gene_type:complete